MSNWSDFEYRCTDFLNNKYSNSTLHFECIGGSNSNISDIKIIKNHSTKGYIEAKMALAQSGQFVLLKDDSNSKFIYSSLNKSDLNASSQIIMDYINDNYQTFKDVNTSSLGIDLSPETFSTWIIQHYLNKGALFIITSSPNEDLIMFKTEDFGKYFTIKANFRRKKSGSSNLPTTHLDSVSKYLETILNKQNINYTITFSNKKYFIELDTPISFNRYQFTINNISYQLSLKSNNLYEIRKLGTTNNPNVIFSIEYNGTSSSFNEFENYLDNI